MHRGSSLVGRRISTVIERRIMMGVIFIILILAILEAGTDEESHYKQGMYAACPHH